MKKPLFNTTGRKPKEIIIRLIILFIGLTIAHLGVTLFLLANLGSDAFNVLVQGIFRTLQSLTGLTFLTHGRTHMCMCFLIIIVLLVVDRTYVKLGTIVCMFCGGPIIDVFTLLLGGFLNDGSSYAARIAGLVLGCVILAFGMTIVIKSDAGTGPNDLVAVVISDKTKKKFSIIRIATDAVFVLAGFLLGGKVGVGTIICVAIVGPVAGIFLPFSEKLVGGVVGRLK